MAVMLRDRGWRDGFHGRDPQESCDAYMEGWHAGIRKGDRTNRAPRRDPNGPGAVGEPSVVAVDGDE